MAKKAIQDGAGRGVRKAASYYPERVAEALKEFRHLNTREARAAFADHWIGLWAREFDDAWPMLYELLEIVREDELYRDPRRVGPGAAGGPETHGDASEYPDFRAYFEDRVGKPFDTWDRLESTYRFVHEYRPELFKGSLVDAQREQQEAKAVRDDVKARNEADHAAKEASRPGRRTDLLDNIQEVTASPPAPTGTSRDRALRRLRRDEPELHARVLAKELSPHAAMVEAGFRPKTFTVRADDVSSAARALRKYLTAEQLAELARLLIDEG